MTKVFPISFSMPASKELTRSFLTLKDKVIHRGPSSNKTLALVRNNLSGCEIKTIGEVQKAVAQFHIDTEQEPLMPNGSVTSITPNGILITNDHVVESVPVGQKAYIKFFDVDQNHTSEPFEVEVLDRNPNIDFALIKMKEEYDGVPHVYMRTSSPKKRDNTNRIGHGCSEEFNYYEPGEVAYPRMSRFHYLLSRKAGWKPSARCIGTLITTDQMQPGDSGGAQLDDEGKLVGVNSSTRIMIPRHIFSNTQSFSSSIHVQRQLLPYLEVILGDEEFKNLLDGNNVNITAQQIKKNKADVMLNLGYS